jgi:surface polysaccharide O-acyltransferase-like enzyme
MNPTSYLLGFVKNPFFLLAAGALLFNEKIRQSVALFRSGLRDVGILQIFYSLTVWWKRAWFVPIQTVI